MTEKSVPLKLFYVVRLWHHTEYGLFGVWIDADEGLPFAVCVERLPIPEGEYLLKRSFYHKGGYEAFEITPVPNRSRILVHKGNIDDQSAGCNIIGEMFDPVYLQAQDRWDYGVLASGKAFTQFMQKLKDVDEARLVVSRWRPT